jgi:hypothetical protein
MSLYDLSKDLENVSDQNLMQMSQDPTAMYPQFLVLAEVQRRNQVRQRYETELAKQQQPQTTVSEEVMMEFAGQSPMPEAESPMQQMAMQEQMPVQQMASGGLTSYQEGGSTALEESFITRGLDSAGDLARERYFNPDGTLNKEQIIKDGLSVGLVASYFTPAGAIRGGLGLLGRGVMSLGKPFTAAGREGIKRSVGRTAAKINPKMIRDPKTGQFRSQAEIGKSAISSVARPLGILGGVGLLQAPEDQPIEEQIEKKDDNDFREKTSQMIRRGKADPLDIAQIGFAIASARNPSELGTGLQKIAAGIGERRMLQSKMQSEQEAQTLNYYLKQLEIYEDIAKGQRETGEVSLDLLSDINTLRAIINQMTGINLGQSQDEEMLAMTSVT